MGNSPPKIVLVSREVAPFGGGGIGVYITSLCRVLREIGDVTLITTSQHRDAFQHCARGDGFGAFPAGVAVEFVEEPVDECAATEYRLAHEWSARVWHEIRRIGLEQTIDLIEFPDWGGEATVTLQAHRTLHESLRGTKVCVRAHSTVEMNATLNGCIREDTEAAKLFDLERFSLRYADELLWAGGEILASYEEFYGPDCLATARRIRHPVAENRAAPRATQSAQPGPLRLLYLGRFERRKGVDRLVSALRQLDTDEIALTMVGGDTPTAAIGTSMREVVELTAAKDPRITFDSARERPGLTELIAAHDVGVLPSVWECWPNVVLEFLAANRPVLATPTGGPLEMIEENVCGWFADDTSVDALVKALQQLARSRTSAYEMIEAGSPRRQFDALTNEDEIRDAYRELLKTGESAMRRHKPTSPLVSIVVPYFALADYVEEAVASLAAQTHEPLELLVVNDGSFEAADTILDRLAEPPYNATLITQENSGVGAARNLGIRQSQGRYFLPFDADNVVDPTFVSRCVEVLEHDASVAYVTSWERLIDERGDPLHPPDWRWHHRFISNTFTSILLENVAGDAPALFRRSLFDAGFAYNPMMPSYEDWHVYQRLAAAGHYGHVIPESLIAYRIRSQSMIRSVGFPNDAWMRGEMAALRAAEPIGWRV